MSDEPSKELSTWVDPAMYSAEPTEGLYPSVTLLSATPDPLGALGAMCAMYEGRVIRDLDADLSTEDRWRYWEQVQKTHLKAPLEAIDLHFMIENVTRAFTHQMVRQRTAVYAQESLRFAVKEQIAARPGPLTKNDPSASKVWDAAVKMTWEAYKNLIANGIPAEEARGLLPHDTLTRLNYKTNLRNLVDHMGNRLCTQAQFEWRMVGAQIKQAIYEYISPNEAHDWQFELIANSGLFKPVCFEMGHCPFQADFDRGCTIRERMDTGRANEVKTEEWLADPTAGWVR
jgi:flavin-dependent thymidylate synthase